MLTNLEFSSDIPSLDRPPCKAPPLCYALLGDATRALKLTGPSQLGILITPGNADIDLLGLTFEIYSHGKLVFATQPVSETLKASDKTKAKSAGAGYLFVLDRDAIEVASRFFLPANTISFSAKSWGKDKANVTLRLVNIEGARARAGSNIKK